VLFRSRRDRDLALMHLGRELQRDRCGFAFADQRVRAGLAKPVFSRGYVTLSEIDDDRRFERRLADGNLIDENLGAGLAHVDREVDRESLDRLKERGRIGAIVGREKILSEHEVLFDEAHRPRVMTETFFAGGQVPEKARVARFVECALELDCGGRVIAVAVEHFSGVVIVLCVAGQRFGKGLGPLRRAWFRALRKDARLIERRIPAEHEQREKERQQGAGERPPHDPTLSRAGFFAVR